MSTPNMLISAMEHGRSKDEVLAFISKCGDILELVDYVDHLHQRGYISAYKWSKECCNLAEDRIIGILKCMSKNERKDVLNQLQRNLYIYYSFGFSSRIESIILDDNVDTDIESSCGTLIL